MNRKSAVAGVADAGHLLPASPRPATVVGLLLASIILLTLAFAPIYQFYLAWIGLVPWMIVVARAKSMRSAFLWSWLGGTGFFVANMWWLGSVTVPGMVALLVYLGIYWGLAAVVLRAGGLLRASRRGQIALSAILIATVWSGLEWVRGNLFTGLPWLYLGHTQTPILPMCQVADVLGVYGVSFWVVLINALIALWLLSGRRWRATLPAAAVAAAVLPLTLAYGLFRMSQDTLSPGPRVLVVQPDFPQAVSGEKSATPGQIVSFHLKETRAALAKQPADLVVWSETMMPPLNPEARERWRTDIAAEWLAREPDLDLSRVLHYPETTLSLLRAVARDNHVGILTGGVYQADWRPAKKGTEPRDRRNSAYLVAPSGALADERYDKIHLVPFGEFIPFKKSIPWLYGLFYSLSPYDYDYTLTGGDESALTVFTLQTKDGPTWSFVTPICFEDIDSRIVARMFRPEGGSNKKRADLIVNLTNDGWFKANENAQHLQAAIFRSIENRVPTARSVNTGISGFIDSCGRTSGLIDARETGTSASEMKLDSRLTLYTRFGDVFAVICVVITGGVLAWAIARRWAARRGLVSSI